MQEETMNLSRWLALALVPLATLAAAPAGAAAQDYPTRPVTIVVPFAPGGTTDLLARTLGQKLEARLGKPFLVENKPGAGSLVGASFVAKAAPDGHTLLMAPSGTMSVNVTLYKNLPYDPVAEFVPLIGAAQTPFVLVVNPALPAHSVQEFIAYARERPGQLSFATAGPGLPHTLFAELFKSMTGITMSAVSYRGSLPALNDVVAGHVPLMFVDLAPAMGILQAGKVRPLGVSTAARLSALPQIPTIAESGVPGFTVASWQMLVAPAMTPRPIVEKLHGELKSALGQPELKDLITRNGMLEMENPSLEGLRDFVKAEIARWGKVVKDAGLAASQ
jgi:tripartite-type tricarboxylate transporter receptor subunit TctC